jgi:hypothetical protein
MMHQVMSKRFPAGLLSWSLVFCFPGFGATNAPRMPVQAELVKAIDLDKIHAGDSILAKVQIEWKDPSCNLRKGAILKGRVVSAAMRSKTIKTSDLAIVFESGECGGREMKPLALTIAALMAPDPASSLYREQENQSLSDAVGLAVGGGASAGTGPNFPGAGGNLRSVTGAAATVYVEPTRYKPPKAILPGQVVGIGGLKLSVGNGVEGSSVLSTSAHRIRLEAGSQFVLVPTPKAQTVTANSSPASAAPPPSTSETTANSATNKAVADATSLDETEICTPPECNVAITSSVSEPGLTQAAASISVKELGYVVGGDHDRAGFDYDSALAYLGPKKLLFTFDPHSLVPRPGAEASPRMRTVRAVLIDLQTMKVLQTTDWRVLDANQYLWPIGNEKVLVHVGRELRIYGSGLNVEQRFSLDGPLSYLRISPLGEYFAVGILKERHSRIIHAQLAEAEVREPEEDIELKVLTADLRTLVTVARSSRDVPPVLSDEGEIRIPSIGKDRWRIVQNSWNGERSVLAQVTSTCRPEATTLQPNLLFLVGCDRQSDGKWYRVLRSNGKLVLKGWSSSAELEQTASGVSSTFAIGVAKAAKPFAPESLFRTTDLVSESVGVYRVENGQRRVTVTISPPVPTLQTFVLSPGGDQLAVLNGDRIAFYGVP